MGLPLDRFSEPCDIPGIIRMKHPQALPEARLVDGEAFGLFKARQRRQAGDQRRSSCGGP